MLREGHHITIAGGTVRRVWGVRGTGLRRLSGSASDERGGIPCATILLVVALQQWDEFSPHAVAAREASVAMAGGVGWMVWRRRGRWRPATASGTPGALAPKRLAFAALTDGKTCLAEGTCVEATTALPRARALETRPQVAERLAAVARRPHAASSPPPASAAS